MTIIPQILTHKRSKIRSCLLFAAGILMAISFSAEAKDKKVLWGDYAKKKGDFYISQQDFVRFIKNRPAEPTPSEKEFLHAENLYQKDGSSKDALKAYEKIKAKTRRPVLKQSALFRMAEISYHQARYENALKTLTDLERKFPDTHLAHETKLLKAHCHTYLEHFAQAEKILTQLSTAQPAYQKDERFNNLFGFVHYQLKNYKKAHAYFDKVISDRALFFMGKLLIHSGKPLFAIENLRELTREYPDSVFQPVSQYLIAEAFFIAKDYSSAIHNYEKFLEMYPSDRLRGPALLKIGCAYLEQDKFLEARTHFQSYLQSTANHEFSSLAQYLIAETFLRDRRFKEAISAYEEMLASFPLDPFVPEARYKLAWCYKKTNNKGKALACLKTLKQDFPRHKLIPYAETLFGNVLSQSEQHKQAASAYQRAIDKTNNPLLTEASFALMSRSNYLDDNHAALMSGSLYMINRLPQNTSPWRMATYLYIAEAYVQQKKYNEAAKMYQTVYDMAPTGPYVAQAMDGMAWCAFFNGDYAKAQELREDIAKMAKEKNLPHELVLQNRFELANALFNQKKYMDALTLFTTFDPENPIYYSAQSVLYRKGLCYYQLEYYRQALESWERLVNIYPNSPEAHQAIYKVADTYFLGNHYNKAKKYFAQIVEKYAKTEEELMNASLRIAQTYYNSKDYIPAIKALKAFIEKFPKKKQAYDALYFLTEILNDPEARGFALYAMEQISAGKTTPVAVESHFRIAVNLYENKEYAKAVESLEDLISQLRHSGKMADANYYLSTSHYKLEEFDNAGKAFHRFAQNFPDDIRVASALFFCGSSHFKGQDYAEAAKIFHELYTRFPQSEFTGTAIYNASLAFKKIKAWEKASQMLLLYKNNYMKPQELFDTDMHLVSLYEEQKKYGQANNLLQAHRQKRRKAWGELSFRMAENHFSANNDVQGLAMYEEIINKGGQERGLENWVLSALVRKGEYLEKAGEKQKALSVYKKICKKVSKMHTKPPWIQSIKERMKILTK